MILNRCHSLRIVASGLERIELFDEPFCKCCVSIDYLQGEFAQLKQVELKLEMQTVEPCQQMQD